MGDPQWIIIPMETFSMSWIYFPLSFYLLYVSLLHFYIYTGEEIFFLMFYSPNFCVKCRFLFIQRFSYYRSPFIKNLYYFSCVEMFDFLPKSKLAWSKTFSKIRSFGWYAMDHSMSHPKIASDWWRRHHYNDS